MSEEEKNQALLHITVCDEILHATIVTSSFFVLFSEYQEKLQD